MLASDSWKVAYGLMSSDDSVKISNSLNQNSSAAEGPNLVSCLPHAMQLCVSWHNIDPVELPPSSSFHLLPCGVASVVL